LRRSSVLDMWTPFKKLKDIEALMRERFEALNDEFDEHIKRASAEPVKPNGNIAPHHYSRSVTRSFNSAGSCGEETIVEQDSQTGKEVKTVTRRIGDRSVQRVDARDIASGAVETSIRRHRLQPDEDAAFDAEWAQVEAEHLPAARGLIHDGHRHHHSAAKQLEDRKKK
jgi:hypothetical protein